MVGTAVGDIDGYCDGSSVGECVVGIAVGASDGDKLGACDGGIVGLSDGTFVGVTDGCAELKSSEIDGV
jgi:hypothetical protein